LLWAAFSKKSVKIASGNRPPSVSDLDSLLAGAAIVSELRGEGVFLAEKIFRGPEWSGKARNGGLVLVAKLPGYKVAWLPGYTGERPLAQRCSTQGRIKALCARIGGNLAVPP
jgi:hypothetical protein